MTSLGKVLRKHLDSFIFLGVPQALNSYLHAPRGGSTPVQENVRVVGAAINSFGGSLSAKLFGYLAVAIIKHRLTGHELAVMVGVQQNNSEGIRWHLHGAEVNISGNTLIQAEKKIGVFNCEIPIPHQDPNGPISLHLALVSIKRETPNPTQRA